MVGKDSLQSSNISLLWSKLSTNWRRQVYSNRSLFRIEQEKLSIALYEIEQTQLDWDRMKSNARAVLDRLDVIKICPSNLLVCSLTFLRRRLLLGSSSSCRIRSTRSRHAHY